MPLALSVDKKRVGFHRFKELDGRYLITNDVGDHCFLEAFQYEMFLKGQAELLEPAKYTELIEKGFVRDRTDFERLSRRYAKRNAFLSTGPSLHIIVTTLRCDHQCVYCQAGSKGLDAKGLDMDTAVAGKVVDRIFEFPSKNITIEFQGGEPLLNFATVRYIVEYAAKKNKTSGKNLMFSLVSNLTFMTDDRLEFFIKNNVGICTSLDGPALVHDRHRKTLRNRSSHKNTTKWIRTIKERTKNNKLYKFRVSALTTVTKDSLPHAKAIIDEFVRAGLEEIHLRPISPFGISRKAWKDLRFSAEGFIDFYKKALDYIIALNLKGTFFSERTAKVFLHKILTEKDPNFLDTRSPCGAGIGQLAYNFDGSVYCCDEARMLSRMNDDSFRLGAAQDASGPQGLLNNPIVKTMATASYLDNLPGCSDCVYKPYCGVCPIYTYVSSGDLFATFKNDRCRINMAILDYLFLKLQEPAARKIFQKWFSDPSLNDRPKDKEPSC